MFKLNLGYRILPKANHPNAEQKEIVENQRYQKKNIDICNQSSPQSPRQCSPAGKPSLNVSYEPFPLPDSAPDCNLLSINE